MDSPPWIHEIHSSIFVIWIVLIFFTIANAPRTSLHVGICGAVSCAAHGPQKGDQMKGV